MLIMEDKLKRQQRLAATKVATYVRETWCRRRNELSRLCAQHGHPVARTYLHQIASGRRKASPAVVRVLVRVSNGDLTDQDGADYCYGV